MKYQRHAADEEGEGYFASVSDLMVGILFVFLLMLTVFALNYRKAEEEQLVQRSLYERLAAATTISFLQNARWLCSQRCARISQLWTPFAIARGYNCSAKLVTAIGARCLTRLAHRTKIFRRIGALTCGSC